MLQLLANGLLIGCVYAAVALSLWLLWSVTRVVNVAHGEFVLLGAYLALWVSRHGWEPLTALLLVVPAAGIIGPLLHGAVFRRLAARPAAASIAVTLGLALAIQGLARMAFTSMPHAAATTLNASWRFGSVTAPASRVAAAVAAAVIVGGCIAMLRATKTGRSIRAVAQNPDAARLVGIETRRVSALTVALALGIAMAAGVLVSQFQHISPTAGLPLTVKAFAIAAVSGLAGFRRVAAASVALGMIESLLRAAAPRGSISLGIVSAAVLLAVALLIPGFVARLHAAAGPRGGSQPVAQAAGGRAGWIACAAAILAALAAPAVLRAAGYDPELRGWYFAATQALTLIAVASSWRIVAARLGRLDLGHAVYFGAGAYAATALVSGGWPVAAALAGGAAAAALGAVAVGAMTLRLPAPLFAVVTLAVMAAAREAVRLAVPLTGGPQGIAFPPVVSQALLYNAMLAVCGVAVALSWALGRRSASAAGPADGVASDDRLLVRLGVYGAAAAATGAVGGLWAAQRLFIDPDNAFSAVRAFDAALASLIGGLGTAAGPLIGGGLLFAAREAWPMGALQWRPILEGLALVGIVLFAPRGLMGRWGGAGDALLGSEGGRGLARGSTRSPAKAAAHVG